MVTKFMSTISIMSKLGMEESEPQLASVPGGAASIPAGNMSQGTDARKDPDDLCINYQQLSGRVLDRRFVLGTPIRNENHAVVFSVELLCSDSGIPGHFEPLPERNVIFEARIYDLCNVSPKLKRYRLRSMKRMASRKAYHQRWHDLEIVVYAVGSINNESYKSNDEMPFGAVQSDTEDMIQDTIPGNRKTNYQRESNRLRQRDKRRAKRCRDAEARAQSAGPVPLPPASSLPTGIVDFDEDTYAMLFLMHIALNTRQQLRDRLPPGHKAWIEGYLQKRGEIPEFQSTSEAADFVTIKENELVSLRRIGKQLPEVKERCHDQLSECLEQLQVTDTSDEKRRLQESTVEVTKARFRVLKSMEGNLPELVNSTEVVLNMAKGMLINLLGDQRKRETENFGSWLHHVIPASDSYTHIVSRFEAADAKAKLSERQLRPINH
ncbi:hypothetical protein BJ166DRAFT_513250 [Pestalotiopsis sp. NC0098]|nr:hypothetical protein BJ166DRAFT_513250 [Pestalotiopsis sp. NC0098]